jgi:hypothetical protein
MPITYRRKDNLRPVKFFVYMMGAVLMIGSILMICAVYSLLSEKKDVIIKKQTCDISANISIDLVSEAKQLFLYEGEMAILTSINDGKQEIVIVDPCSFEILRKIDLLQIKKNQVLED